MLDTSLYHAMLERRSIRHYDDTKPLTDEQIALAKASIANAQPLLPGETYRLELARAKEGWRIYGFCEATQLSHVNLGFVMQQIDLALHAKGLGRLWFGMGLAPKDIQAPAGMVYAMAMKIGCASIALARPLAGFDRKAIEEVTDAPTLHALLEPVRLAPSARNSQPWFFTLEGQTLHAWRARHRSTKKAHDPHEPD
ncbi:MAG: hypothetical protein LBB50_05985 [Oscillospiraceae bacterium]|jgi:nitroreductase|nr:hypothetical protein [Oscillospiraceae bacterium]